MRKGFGALRAAVLDDDQDAARRVGRWERLARGSGAGQKLVQVADIKADRSAHPQGAGVTSPPA
jgi:hypothetical protein